MFPSLMCVTFLGTVGAEPWFPPLPIETVNRNLLQLKDSKGVQPTSEWGLGYIRAAGPRAYPALLAVLQDPHSGDNKKRLALGVLCDQPHDRSVFVDVTIELLGHEKRWVRETSLELLSEIGSGDQVEKVFPLLYHEDVYTRKPALKTIVTIGDVRHVPALGKYLSPPPPDLIQGGSFHSAVQDAIKELENKPTPKAKPADKR